MNSSMRTSASGMAAQQRMIDVIANNLANVNTTAFKRSRVSFEDVLYETLEGARVVNYQGTQTVAPVQVGKGVHVGAIVRLQSQGSPENTQRPLDLAIEGDGFFQIAFIPVAHETGSCRVCSPLHGVVIFGLSVVGLCSALPLLPLRDRVHRPNRPTVQFPLHCMTSVKVSGWGQNCLSPK